MNRFEQFREFRDDLSAFLGSVVQSVANPRLFTQKPEERYRALSCLVTTYPFLEVCYLLDASGHQLGDNAVAPRHHRVVKPGGNGMDRSHRPYYRLAKEADRSILTAPYLSTATGSLCVTVAAPIRKDDGDLVGMVVADINLDQALALLEEDHTRRGFEPFFKAVYAVFSAGLAGVSLALGFHGFLSLRRLWVADIGLGDFSIPFRATILLTLALAVFDLAKTILEEEVLMRKDVRRHSATRRTLTRFIAAILIAVSIEGLMLIFKFSIDTPQLLPYAVWLLMAAAGLLTALGLYVYFGARAEVGLLRQKEEARRWPHQDG